MTTIKKSIGTLALVATMALTVSCKDANKVEAPAPMTNDMPEKAMDSKESLATNNKQDPKAEIILKDYFNLKDALVNDDHAKAKEQAMTLTNSLKSFDASSYSENEQTELKGIIHEATTQAAHIGDSDIKTQREHFKILSKAVTEMVAITGTEMTLYEQFCPMYDRGTAWLSTKEEVRNPYYGSQMLKCGVVQREIN